MAANRRPEKPNLVFTSDHGDMMGAHHLLAKCVMFREVTRVPLLMRIPGLQGSGMRIANAVSRTDLVPTLLQLMGHEPSAELQGSSWVPFLRDNERLREEDVFIEWNGMNNGFGDIVGGVSLPDPWRQHYGEEELIAAQKDPVRMIVTADRWRYSWSTRGEDELSHLIRDPYEMHNLSGMRRWRPLIGELRRRIVSWQERTGDRTPHRSS